MTEKLTEQMKKFTKLVESKLTKVNEDYDEDNTDSVLEEFGSDLADYVLNTLIGEDRLKKLAIKYPDWDDLTDKTSALMTKVISANKPKIQEFVKGSGLDPAKTDEYVSLYDEDSWETMKDILRPLWNASNGTVELSTKTATAEQPYNNIFQMNGKEYNFRDLPDNLVIDSNFNLAGHGWTGHNLPKNLTVTGDFDLSHSSKAKGHSNPDLYVQVEKILPSGLKVGGNLNISHSAVIKRLPDDLVVGGKILVSKGQLSYVPLNLKNKIKFIN